MGIRTMAAVWACKMTRAILRKIGKGGTNVPGRVALAIAPDLLGTLAENVTTVIVTGTNGKTTTSRMIESSLRDAGLSYFCNKSGANMLSGITAEFAMHADRKGRNRCEYALIECDEAAFRTVSRYVDAKCVVVTNIFRDQLDRYGEVTHTRSSILEGLKHSPHATVCLNADCSLSVSLKEEINNPVVFYGVNTEIYRNKVQELSDAPYCIHCKTEYVYDYRTFGHLGGFRCPHCGYHRPMPSVCVKEVRQSTVDGSGVLLQVGEQEYEASINLPGGYNIYNAIAAVTAGRTLGLEEPLLIESLNHFECGFGRMEKFSVEGTDIRMILIKNPAGCNQVLNFLSSMTGQALFVVALNDRDADGTDISWIWDVDFEKLTERQGQFAGIWTTGVRAEEMAMRFLYAGIPAEKLRVVKDYDELLTEMAAQKLPVYLMPTYTAMLDIRERFSSRYGFHEFWE